MGNNTSHYFGAYFEISVNKKERIDKVSQCDNGHHGWGDFCMNCGGKITMRDVKIVEYPCHIADDIVSNSYEDVLSVITPPSLFRKGVIIAVGNIPDVDDNNGGWLYISRYEQETEIKEFPNDGDIARMKRGLEKNYVGIIAALEASPDVRDVKIKCGYVLDAEF